MAEEGDLLTGGTQAEPEGAGNQTPEGPGESESTPVSDGSERPGWMDQLKGDLKDSDSLRKFESASDLAKSYVELEGKLGNAVTLSEEPTEEELSRVRSLLGVPENEEGYDFSDVDLPEGFTLNDVAKEDLSKFAKSNDMTVTQAKAVLQRMADREAAAVKEARRVIKENREKAETALRKELGADYDKVLKGGQRLVQEYGDEELAQQLKETGFGNSPAMVKFLGNVSAAFSEAEAPRGDAPDLKRDEGPFPVAARMAKNRTSNYE
jgi:hypothetical protein